MRALRRGMPFFCTAYAQLVIVLISLLVIASASTLLTYVGTSYHDQHYVGMAVIERQRELQQELSWIALADPQNPEFVADVDAFQKNIALLREGGEFISSGRDQGTISAAYDPLTQAELDRTLEAWQLFRADIQALWSMPLTAPKRSEKTRALHASMPVLSHKLNDLAEIYEQHLEGDVGKLRLMQVAALLLALPLRVWGYLIIRSRIVRPAAVLATAAQPARRQQPAPYMLAEAYDDELWQLLQAFAATRPEINAAHKMVEAQISDRTRLLMTTIELSQQIAGHLDLNTLLKHGAQKAMVLLDAHSSAIRLFESEGTYLELVLAQGKGGASIDLHTAPPNGHPLRVINLADSAGDLGSCASCAFRQAGGPVNCLSTPLQAGKKKIGSLCVVRDQDQPFDVADRRALGLLSSVAAVAISNAQLMQSSRYSTQQSALLAERKRLTAEIHDNLAQTLSYLNLRVERVTQLVAATESAGALAEIESLRSAAHQAYGQARTLLNNLRDPKPQPVAAQVVEAISTFCTDFCQVTGLKVELSIVGADIDRLAPMAQAQLLNIVREALTNVNRHARATQISVRGWQAQHSVCFAIEDNGIGFNRADVRRQDAFGLAIMQARAERSGGALTIHSEPGKGTRVSVVFPLNLTHSLSTGAADSIRSGRVAQGAAPGKFV